MKFLTEHVKRGKRKAQQIAQLADSALTEHVERGRRRINNVSIRYKLLGSYLVPATCLVVVTCLSILLMIYYSTVMSGRSQLMEKAAQMAEILSDEDGDEANFHRMRTAEELMGTEAIFFGQDMVAKWIPTDGGPGPKPENEPEPKPRPEDEPESHPEAEGEPELRTRPEDQRNEEREIRTSRVFEALEIELIKEILNGESVAGVREMSFMDGKVLYAGVPVRGVSGIIGAAILYRSFTEIEDLTTRMWLMFFMTGLPASMLALYVAWGLSRRVAKPIQTVTEAARRMAEGQYGEPVILEQRDEIGVLGDVLSGMSLKLKQTIGDLKDEKSKLEQILVGIGEGIVAVNRTGNVVHYNNAALELLELSAWNAEAAPETARHRQTLTEMLCKAASSGERTNSTWKNNAGRSIAVKVWPMTGEEGEVLGAVALLRDVSEEERLEQMRKDYIANISHELRTPLTGIRGMVEPLMDGYIETEEEKAECYRIIHQEAGRLEKMIGEMLELSRLQAGRAAIVLEPVEAEDAMEAAYSRMLKRAQEAGVTLQAEISAPLPKVLGNDDRILQVLIILMDNALSFTQPGGTVTLTARSQGRYVYLGVADTGAGIDPADLPYIWERFYKADKSRLRTTGTGLGLAIAKQIVEYMDGMITVQSEPGKGSAFEFSLRIFGE